VCVIAVISFVTYYSLCSCYKPATELSGLSVKCHNDDTLRIAFVGDSWAYLHESVECIMDSLITNEIGKPVIIRNAGEGGLVSKEVYYSLFNNEKFKDVLEWGPNFCYITAGINDTNKKSGCDNYAENMRLIISLLLKHNIIPVIQEIPYYDISFSFFQMKPLFLLRSIRSMLWTWSKLDCIDDYTICFDKMVEKQKWQDDVIIIRRDYWNPKGFKEQQDLYTIDRMHLSQKGYFVLDSCIASKIVSYIKERDSLNSTNLFN